MARIAVDAWAPEYGSGADEAALTPSDVPTDLAVEVREDEWAPRRPPATVAALADVVFVDGIRRIEAHAWVTGDDGQVSQGICAAYAAGAVRSNGRAEVVTARVGRGLFTRPLAGVTALETRVGRSELSYAFVPVASDQFERLSLALQDAMGRLEAAVADDTAAAAAGAGLVLVDGPLRERHRVAGAVGYVKRHEAGYGTPVVRDTIDRLLPGERTPVFLVGDRFRRFSWYVRLPGALGGHPFAGVVRCELAPDDAPSSEVIARADQVAATLPRFASRPHKDPRAPQNLYPVAGLERALRRRLGDPALVLRALRATTTRVTPQATNAG
ncbi:MAG: DNA double-strand break repair nuclease NurA [Acidimicrobiales bacterium]